MNCTVLLWLEARALRKEISVNLLCVCVCVCLLSCYEWVEVCFSASAYFFQLCSLKGPGSINSSSNEHTRIQILASNYPLVTPPGFLTPWGTDSRPRTKKVQSEAGTASSATRRKASPHRTGALLKGRRVSLKSFHSQTQVTSYLL